MTDAEIDCFLEKLRAYHGANRVTLRFDFEDGQSVQHICEERK